MNTSDSWMIIVGVHIVVTILKEDDTLGARVDATKSFEIR